MYLRLILTIIIFTFNSCNRYEDFNNCEKIGEDKIISINQMSASHFQLSTNNPELVRKQLLELSLKNNLNIVSLQSESNSLEDIFRNLTSANN